MLITEILNKDAVKAALDRSNKSDYYDKILSLDPTKDKNAVYSVKLTKFFLEPRSDNDEEFIKILKYYFDKFMLLKDREILKGKDADFNSIRTFKDFHNLIDSAEAELLRTKSPDYTATIIPPKVEPDDNQVEIFGKKINKKDITYADDNVVVTRADNPSKSKRYGGKFGNWCTTRPVGNLFYTYRFDYEETMYFVYFLKKDKNDMEMVLHFGIDEDGEISYTDRTNVESTQTLSWLVDKFPELAPAVAKNAFPVIPLTPTERRIKELPDRLTPEQYGALNYEEKEMWQLAEDREVDMPIWNLMDDNFRNMYVRDFSGREDDIDSDVYQNLRGTKYETSYHAALLERIEDKLTKSGGELNTCTLHELGTIKDKPLILKKLTDLGIYDLLQHSPDKDKDEMAKTIISIKGNDLNDYNINNLLKYSLNRVEMSKTIISLRGNNLSDSNVHNLLYYSSNRDEMARTIINVKGNNLSGDMIYSLLQFSLNKVEMAKTILNFKGNNLSDYNVFCLLSYSTDTDEIAKTIIRLKGSNLSDEDINNLLKYSSKYSSNKVEMAKTIISLRGNNLSDINVNSLLEYSPNKDETIKTIINVKGSNLSDNTVNNLLKYSSNKVEMAKTIISLRGNNLSDSNVHTLLYYSLNKDEMAKTIINLKGNDLNDYNINNLLEYSLNKDEMAKTIISLRGNNLSDSNVHNLLYYSSNKDEMAKTIINLKGSNLSDNTVNNLLIYSPNVTNTIPPERMEQYNRKYPTQVPMTEGFGAGNLDG